MKYSNIFREKVGSSDPEEVFGYFLKTLKETIKGWDFFVDWGKIFSRIRENENTLAELNSLIGKENIREDFKNLVSKHPEIVEMLPILLAIREKSIKVLEATNLFRFKEYYFSKKNKGVADKESEIDKESETYIESLTEFAEKSGILEIFGNKRITNIVDYVMGVEVGLDSNARKNRCGTAMESITESFVKDVCDRNGYRYIAQATSSKIKAQFGIEVRVDKSERSFDFAVDTGTKLYLMETNYYGGGGSKLKSVAGEFTSLFNFLRSVTPEHGFIWITDGKGWETTVKPLKETFDKIDYIFNLDMLEKGILDDILNKGA